MFSIAILAVFAILTLRSIQQTHSEIQPASNAITRQMTRLWRNAQEALLQNQYLRAEKALLSILHLDKSNANAYNRLGIIYARQSEYDDAADCFNIARSIAPNPQSLHNLGLVYYLKKDYKKSILAFENAIAIDDSSAARFQALAKALAKDKKKVLATKALEKAYAIDPQERYKEQLLALYNETGDKSRHRKLIENTNSRPTLPTSQRESDSELLADGRKRIGLGK